MLLNKMRIVEDNNNYPQPKIFKMKISNGPRIKLNSQVLELPQTREIREEENMT